MPFLPDGTPVDIVLNPIGVPSRMNIGQILETHLGWSAYNFGFKTVTPVFDGARDTDIEDGLARLWLAQNSGGAMFGADGRPTIDREHIIKWIDDKGYSGEDVMSEGLQGTAREVCLRLWLEEQGIESRQMQPAELKKKVDELAIERNLPSPIGGKVMLRDGRTGEAFDQPVTVGNIYMMKLIHLVEDKVHARATGPYSLISQQPLGGKAQFGGQRFGEMEVWSLEAYGAAHNLQEVLTIKSDDVAGRAKTYEAIVKGEDILPPGVPESFKVLVKELQSLGLAIEVINEEEKVIQADKIREPEIEGRPEALVDSSLLVPLAEDVAEDEGGETVEETEDLNEETTGDETEENETETGEDNA
jgi:DNA-directed RNA polymerase subunit beta